MGNSFVLVLILLLVLNLFLISFAILDIMQRERVKYLPRFGWIIFMTLVFFGAAVYLLAGRGEEKPR